MNPNIANLQIAIAWLKDIIKGCLNVYFGTTKRFERKPLNFYNESSWLGIFIEHNSLEYEEFIVLLLAIVPHIQPHLFNQIISEYLPEGGDFPDFGGVKAKTESDLELIHSFTKT